MKVKIRAQWEYVREGVKKESKAINGKIINTVFFLKSNPGAFEIKI